MTTSDQPTTNPGIQITDAVVTVISQHLPDITDEQVNAVLSTWNSILNGDPLGTVRLDPNTGHIAYRVSLDGVHMWKVTAPDGGTWQDMQPSLPWPVISNANEQSGDGS
jgi:hypothetical protein